MGVCGAVWGVKSGVWFFSSDPTNNEIQTPNFPATPDPAPIHRILQLPLPPKNKPLLLSLPEIGIRDSWLATWGLKVICRDAGWAECARIGGKGLEDVLGAGWEGHQGVPWHEVGRD